MNEEFPKDPIDLDAEYAELLNAAAHDDFEQDYSEYAEEEDRRVARVIPVLRSHNLIPSDVDDSSVDSGFLLKAIFSQDTKIRDFAHRTLSLMSMVETADYANKYSNSQNLDRVIEDMQEDMGDILKNNPDYEQWIEVGRELIGDLLPLSEDPNRRAVEIEMLPVLADAVTVQMRDRIAAVKGIRIDAQEKLLSEYGHHDDLNDIVQDLITLATVNSVSDAEHRLDKEEVYKRVIKDRRVNVGIDLLYSLFEEATDKLRKAYS